VKALGSRAGSRDERIDPRLLFDASCIRSIRCSLFVFTERHRIMRQGHPVLITRENLASTRSNPYDMDPTNDATDAIEARSSTATGPEVAPQLSLGLNATLRDVPLAPRHMHRDARGMFSTEEKCVHPECCTRTEPENDAPPFPVPDGFFAIPNDQGEWLIVSRPSTGVSNARDAAIAPALPSPHGTAVPDARGAVNASALPLFPTAYRADRSLVSVDSPPSGPAEPEMHLRIERSSARGPHSIYVKINKHL
jgi:hypothetical protein